MVGKWKVTWNQAAVATVVVAFLVLAASAVLLQHMENTDLAYKHAYRDGNEAGTFGRPFEVCPFPEGSTLAKHWQAGWIDAKKWRP